MSKQYNTFKTYTPYNPAANDFDENRYDEIYVLTFVMVGVYDRWRMDRQGRVSHIRLHTRMTNSKCRDPKDS